MAAWRAREVAGYTVLPSSAGVVKLADARDSKSRVRKDVSVRFRPPAPPSSVRIPDVARRSEARSALPVSLLSTVRATDDRPVPATGVSWFSTLWVLAFSFHYLDRDGISLVPFLVALAAVPVLVWPASVRALGAFVAVSSLGIAYAMPAPANHLMLAGLAHLALALSAVWWRLHGRRIAAGDLLAVAAPGICGALLVAYGWAAFHKLNTDFFSPASCAGALIEGGAALWGRVIHLPLPIILLLAWMTIACELAIPVLLAMPRTRKWGLTLGVGFHLLLGTIGFADFSTFAFAAYVLFAAPVLDRITAPAARRRLALGLWALHLLCALTPRALPESLASQVPWPVLVAAAWMATVGVFMLPLLRAVFAAPADTPPRLATMQPVLLLVPLLALLNGLTPYLGVRTVANFSMFSNLRVEGGTNHLLPFVRHLRVSGMVDDLVEVREARSPEGPASSLLSIGGRDAVVRQFRWMPVEEGSGVRVPFTEVRRAVVEHRRAGVPLTLSYVREGQRVDLADATADPVLAAPLPWWSRWLTAFRAVAGDVQPCLW